MFRSNPKEPDHDLLTRKPKQTHRQSSSDLPEILAKAKLDRKNLVQTNNNLQIQLTAIEQRIAKSQSILKGLYSGFLNEIAVLTRYRTELRGFKNDLLGLVRLKTEQLASVNENITRFEVQRKSLMAKMTNPQWNKRQWFYMLALERFWENKQVKQIIEIAKSIPGNMAITAVAQHSIQQHKQACANYNNLKVDRCFLDGKHSSISKKLQSCNFRLSWYENLLLSVKKNVNREDKKKICKAERITSADSGVSKPFTKSNSLCWRFKQHLFGNAETFKEGFNEDEESFWKNVDVQKLIRYLDDVLSEIEERFVFTKMEDTTNKFFQGFQNNNLYKFLDDSSSLAQCSNYIRAHKSSGSIPGWDSSIVKSQIQKKGAVLKTPTSLEGVTVETVPYLAGNKQRTVDFIEGCSVDLKALNELLETISAARNDHKNCFSNLNISTKKIKELDLEISNYDAQNMALGKEAHLAEIQI